MKEFECTNCYNKFKAKGYDNPCFYADTVADCTKCGRKSWEVLYKITKSEYDRLEKAGVDIRLFS